MTDGEIRALVWEAAKRASKMDSIKMSGVAREAGWNEGGIGKFLLTRRARMDKVRRLGQRLTELGILAPTIQDNSDQTPEIMEAAEALVALRRVLLNQDETLRARLYLVRGCLERLERDLLGPIARGQKDLAQSE